MVNIELGKEKSPWSGRVAECSDVLRNAHPHLSPEAIAEMTETSAAHQASKEMNYHGSQGRGIPRASSYLFGLRS